MAGALITRILLLLTLCAPAAGTAHGHATLVESRPADGAVLPVAPDHIRLLFNEPVSPIALRVLDAAGRDVVTAGAMQARDGAIEMALPPSLARGSYVVSYRVVSTDGHPIGGSLVFSVGEASTLHLTHLHSHDRGWHSAWAAVRAMLYAGLLGSAGGVLFLFLVAGSHSVAAGAARIVQRLALLGLAAALLSIGVHGALLIGGPFEALAGTEPWHAGFASMLGNSAIVACAGLVLMLAGMSLSLPAAHPIALIGAVIALASFALTGHVVTAGPTWLTAPALIAHISAVAFWVGSLLPLRGALSDTDAGPLVRRFSAAAAVAVAVLAVSGTVIAWLQVGSFHALLTTTYGRVLLAKLALVCGLLSLAALNKWRYTPALARGEAGALLALRRTIAAELAIVVAILATTAALGTTPPPRALGPSGMHASEHHSMHGLAHGPSIEMQKAGLKATVTFASSRSGANHIEITIIDASGAAVEAPEVVFTAENTAAAVAPFRRTAVPVRPGTWDVANLLLVPAGRWSVRVEALVSDFEKPIFEGQVDLQ